MLDPSSFLDTQIQFYQTLLQQGKHKSTQEKDFAQLDEIRKFYWRKNLEISCFHCSLCKGKGLSSSMRRFDPSQEELNKTFTIQEKHHIMQSYQRLPPSDLRRLMQILQERGDVYEDEHGEIEIDLNTFRTKTLLIMHHFVTECQHKTRTSIAYCDCHIRKNEALSTAHYINKVIQNTNRVSTDSIEEHAFSIFNSLPMNTFNKVVEIIKQDYKIYSERIKDMPTETSILEKAVKTLNKNHKYKKWFKDMIERWATYEAPKQIKELEAELNKLEGDAFHHKQKEIDNLKQHVAHIENGEVNISKLPFSLQGCMHLALLNVEYREKYPISKRKRKR